MSHIMTTMYVKGLIIPLLYRTLVGYLRSAYLTISEVSACRLMAAVHFNGCVRTTKVRRVGVTIRRSSSVCRTIWAQLSTTPTSYLIVLLQTLATPTTRRRASSWLQRTEFISLTLSSQHKEDKRYENNESSD